MYSPKYQGQYIIFSHIYVKAKIVLFFEDIGKRSKKYGQGKKKFQQLLIVFDYPVTRQGNCDGITHDEKYQKNYHSFPVFYGKYNQ